MSRTTPPAGPVSLCRPDWLYKIVVDYAGFGAHLTGTDADRSTADWLTNLICEIGGTATFEPFAFDRFDVRAKLVTNGRAVPSVPLYYSATGSFDTDDVQVVRFGAGVAGSASAFEERLRSLDSRAVVIAVDGPDELPVQCNRFPTKMLGVPGVIVPGNWFDRLGKAQLRLRFDASIEPATSANVLATFGSADSPVIAVTTPLTGWTPAAGERGTGLAAALAVAVELSSEYSVHFSACSGHEIDHIGLRHHLAQRDVRSVPVIHFGASIGAGAVEPGVSGALELASTRMALTTATGPCRADIAELTTGANWTLRDVEPPWPGEGGTWQEAGAPVLSFLGPFTLFHTAHDTPERATTLEALHLATTVALAAARRFLEDASQ
ncbi:hypothetical protein [Candidatus Poriferisodalis sp.]|uniref:hypothetical protein n=1 Tax=Candidatus Poriferisodalis sp. TaxID=3101277 RepID=UPI003C6ED282